MSVAEIEKQVRTLPAEELVQFGEWFDAYRESTLPAADADDDLSEDQKQEILRRRDAYLADPSLAEPWEGTAERLIQELHAYRRQKAASGGH
jgi:hypothetical protein